MKKILLILGIITVLLIAVVYFFSTGGQRAEKSLKNANPIFHTVVEGGSCRDGQGDCQGGLTCTSGVCAKP